MNSDDRLMLVARRRSLRTAFVTSAIWMAGSIGAFAQGPAVESFSYPAGSVSGRDGGSGWLGAWGVPGTSTAPVIGGGLAYGGLSVAGGALIDSSGSSHAGTRKWFNPSTAFADGATVWFSCLLRYDTSHNSDILVLPFGNKGMSSEGYGIAINTRATANAATWGTIPTYSSARVIRTGVSADPPPPPVYVEPSGMERQFLLSGVSSFLPRRIATPSMSG
jgi:hypothetical protein